MIFTLLDVVLPVFLVIAAGYAATRLAFISEGGIDGLMVFTQNFAIPCLLFRATMTLDLGANVDPGMMISFYAGATVSFTLGILGARYLFGRRPGEAVAIGFAGLFSNSVLLGLPIMERAYGADALGPNYAIVALHAPFCYFLGITAMEFARADGRGFGPTMALVGRAMTRNALMIAIYLGIAANLTGFRPPDILMDAVDMMIRAALPAALFGLGGVLTRYAIRDKLGEVGQIAVLSLMLHPLITWMLARHVFDLPIEMVRAAVLTAAMAPGVNTYIFARMYNRATGVNSSAVLLCTLISVLSVTFWLSILP